MDISWALNQTAVYWKRLGPMSDGEYYWEDPVEIACRWVIKTGSKNQSDTRNLQTETELNVSEVMVDRDMYSGDYLYLGTLDDLTSASVPYNTKEAYKIKMMDKIPDLGGEEFTYKAYL